MSALPRPRIGLFAHLGLLLGLRLEIERNRFRKLAGVAPLLLGLAALAGIGGALGLGAWALLTQPGIAASPRWSSFVLRLVLFLTSTIFIVWPVLAAGVDEHTELSRFATFPIRPFRLFLSSSVAALFEPRAVVFYPIVFGAVLGYGAQRPVGGFDLALALGAYLLFNAAWARAALTIVLNVLRHRRSAEILGLVFIGALFLSALAPPVDARWVYSLFQEGAAGAADGLDEKMVRAATLALGRLPAVSAAVSVEAAARGFLAAARILAVWQLLWAALGYFVAYRLLVRFYKHTARPEKRTDDADSDAAVAHARGGAFRALVDRELADFVRNPKARLLVAVPFFLCILLHLVRARDLVAAAAGASADAWLLGVLCVYGGLVVAANFAQNAFAYDGHGLALLYAAPIPLRSLLIAKNLVHAIATVVVSLALTAFYGFYVHPLTPVLAVAGPLMVVGVLPLLLAAGNVLSIVSPRKFHASLRRRDRPPALATMGGLVAAAVAVMPMGVVLRRLGHGAPDALTLLALLFVALFGWGAYAVALPYACGLLERRRELVLRAVMRE